MHFRESLGTVFHQQQQQGKRSPPVQDLSSSAAEVPCKKFKLEDSTKQETTEEPDEKIQEDSSKNQLALNLAARLLTARAQFIQHHQQVLLQHHQNDSQKWQPQLQMLQMAHLQAYLASVASASSSNSNANKTENQE